MRRSLSIRPRAPLMRLMIEVQCETRVAETILGRSRVCVQRREFWPFGQYSCQLRLGQYSCQLLSPRPQLSVFEDMSVFLPLSPALVVGFRRFPVAVVSQRRWRTRGKKAWARPSVGTLGEAGDEGARTVPGRVGDDGRVAPVRLSTRSTFVVGPGLLGRSCQCLWHAVPDVELTIDFPRNNA